MRLSCRVDALPVALMRLSCRVDAPTCRTPVPELLIFVLEASTPALECCFVAPGRSLSQNPSLISVLSGPLIATRLSQIASKAALVDPCDIYAALDFPSVHLTHYF